MKDTNDKETDVSDDIITPRAESADDGAFFEKREIDPKLVEAASKISWFGPDDEIGEIEIPDPTVPTDKELNNIIKGVPNIKNQF